MKLKVKLLLLLVSTIISTSSLFAQSVLDIPFGTSYEKTKELLKQRFGRLEVIDDSGKLTIYDFQMGNYFFHAGYLQFQYSGGQSYLNQAHFELHFELNDVTLAKESRDALNDIIYSKYGKDYYEVFTNDDGFKCYKFGLNPKDKSKVLGIIELRKGKGNDGKSRLYLNLDYLPIEFISFTSDF